MMINLSRQLFAVAICLSLVAYNAPLLAEVLIAEKNVDSQVDLWGDAASGRDEEHHHRYH